MSNIFSAFRITASALSAERLRMDVISNNVANAETTRTDNGEPYQRRQVVFAANELRVSQAQEPVPSPITGRFDTDDMVSEFEGGGVRVAEVIVDDSPGRRVYDPSHPDADEEGFVTYPNVNVVTEMVDMLSATRSYEANVTTFNALKSMAKAALEIGKNG